MENIEKKCLHGLKRQNKLFANTICIEKKSLQRSQINLQTPTEIRTKCNKCLFQILLRIFKLNKHKNTPSFAFQSSHFITLKK